MRREAVIGIWDVNRDDCASNVVASNPSSPCQSDEAEASDWRS
jgi:hypothetical protein